MSTTDQEPPDPLQGDGFNQRLWRKEAWRRCHVDNQHFMLSIVGREGLGKSYTALRLGEVLDPDFGPERVVFEPERMLELMDSDETGPGSVVVLDESGVGLGNRSWYEKDQIKLNQALQTIRDHNLVGIFTLPRLHELDSQTRARLHAFCEMTHIDTHNDRAFAKYKRIEVARDDRDSLWTPYPRMKDGNRTQRVVRISFGKPDAELVEPYEERKAEFQQQLYREIIDDGGDDGWDDPEKVAADLLEDDDWHRCVKIHGGNKMPYLDWRQIKQDYDISRQKAKSARDLVKDEVEIEEAVDG